ncbi:dihydroorotate dehydrogenase-like protein [candidate division KSB1 bacterium]|nr:dihydroorotate dehydrogenase-like protein [candidate division KSB1 bacterium]
MADLRTTYMGIELKNPIIVGASQITADMDTIKKIEKAGAGALVVKSLFEEQIQLERFKLEQELTKYDERHAEMVTIFPRLEHAGPAEHLMWVKKAKKSVSIPVIASLNAVTMQSWIQYAEELQNTGVDGLELNFYTAPDDLNQSGESVEAKQLEITRAIDKVVNVPFSVKLSPFYSNPLHFIARLDKENVAGFVLFNQLFQPDIDTATEKNCYPFYLSDAKDHRLPLRFAGLLYGQVNADLCANTGIFTGQDVVKMLLAGADCVQVVSTLYKNGIDYISTMLGDIESWMKAKGYKKLEDFRGKLSRKNSADPWIYKRAQYVRLLLRESPIE